ncbi:hypothetical protein OIU84_011663 [Salix udensis]|uniref:Uncharacterized protein n=1 Tax=Salix udensis TaxID=889485 RepID=A0AAD6JNM6_9ROSI|nr:hypothetical protein OIU84_011663 [Salix udensis]
MNMKVQILSRKLIAPSSPTPPNLQNLKISCFDQLAPPTYVPCIFYYPVSEYLEAQVSGSLSQLLGREEFKTEMWWRLVVPQVFRPENNPLLTIQFNRFECGGVAIGSCVAHRIADAYTVGTFINTWAAACRTGIGKVHRRPGFPFGSLFPPMNIPATTSADDLISAGAIKKHGEKKREMPT